MKTFWAVFEVEFKSERLLLSITLRGWNLHSVGKMADEGTNHWAELNPVSQEIDRYQKNIGTFSDLKFLGCGGICCTLADPNWLSGVLVEFEPHRYCLERDKENVMKPEPKIDSLEMAKLEIMKQLQGMGQNIQGVPLPKSKEIH